MSLSDYTHTLTQAVSELSDKHSYEGLFHQYKDGDPLPSGKSLRRIVELSREILFPGYFGNSTVHRRTINYHIGVNVEELFGLLTEQIQAGLCFGLENTPSDNVIKKIPDRDTAASIAARFISKLPEIRRILATDVEAAYYLVKGKEPKLFKNAAGKVVVKLDNQELTINDSDFNSKTFLHSHGIEAEWLRIIKAQGAKDFNDMLKNK